MTRDEINREVAIRVMGWHLDNLGEGDYSLSDYYEYFDSNGPVMSIEDWNPAERIDHAEMVLEKFDSWRVWKSGGKYAAELLSVGYKCCLGDTAPMAICLAALKAKEGDHEG